MLVLSEATVATDRERKKKKKKERKSSKKYSQRKKHNVKLSSWLISCSVRSHVVVGGLTPVSRWTQFFPSEPFSMANFS